VVNLADTSPGLFFERIELEQRRFPPARSVRARPPPACAICVGGSPAGFLQLRRQSNQTNVREIDRLVMRPSIPQAGCCEWGLATHERASDNPCGALLAAGNELSRALITGARSYERHLPEETRSTGFAEHWSRFLADVEVGGGELPLSCSRVEAYFAWRPAHLVRHHGILGPAARIEPK